jgi:roadblock/LC7 domain-containing protein
VFQPASAGPLYKVSANGGAVEQVTVLDTSMAEDAHRWPDFLPDGRHFIYVALPMAEGFFRTYLGSIDGGIRKPVIEATGAPVFAEPGFMVFARNRSLFAQPFDVKRLELTGAPLPIGEDAGTASGWTGGPEVSVSMNGVLAHGMGTQMKRRLTWLDRNGKEIGRLNLADALYSGASISPDGRRVAYVHWRTGAGPLVSDIWTLELDRDVATRFTFDGSENQRPMWSPDSKLIAFTSNRDGTENLHIKPLDGSSRAEMLYKSKALFTKAGEWSPDGKYVIFHTLGKEGGFDLWALPMDGERKPVPIVVTPFNELDGVWSPDGRMVAYRSDESGRFELYVQSFPSGAGKYRVSTSGAGNYGEGFNLGFRDDGGELLYVGGDNVTVMTVELKTDGEFRAGKPKALFRIEGSAELGVGLDVTPDAQRFLYAKELLEKSSLSVVVNWPEILER